MRRASWLHTTRLVLAALAFAGVWLWLGDGMRVLGPAVIVVAVTGLWVLRLVRPSEE